MHYTITRSAVHQHARQLLQSCLRLPDFSPACTAGLFLHVLFAACARVCSLSAACWSLSRAPSRETIRRALLRWLPARDELLRRLNRALSVEVPRAWRRRPQPVAIDLTLIPYHGLPFTDVLEIYRTGQERHQPFPRLCHRLRQLSGSALHPGFDLGAAGREAARSHPTSAPPPVPVGRLGADAVAGPGLLECERHPLPAKGALPLPDAGGAARAPGGSPARPQRYARVRRAQAGRLGRIHADRRGQTNGAGVDLYSLPQLPRAVGAARTADVGICLLGNPTGEHAMGARNLPETLCHRDELPSDAPREGRTCTRHPEVRLLLVGVALVLRNVWVWLHYAVLSTPRRGNRRFNLERLTLETLLLWLLHQAEQELGCRDHVCAEHPMPQ